MPLPLDVLGVRRFRMHRGLRLGARRGRILLHTRVPEPIAVVSSRFATSDEGPAEMDWPWPSCPERTGLLLEGQPYREDAVR